MIWVELLVLLVLVFSFFSGFKEGAGKKLLFSDNLNNFLSSHWTLVSSDGDAFCFPARGKLGKFYRLFYYPRIDKCYFAVNNCYSEKNCTENVEKGVYFWLIGGGLNHFNASVGLVVFTLVIGAYPFVSWLEKVVTNSSIPSWLITQLGFVQLMLPEIFQETAPLVVTVLVILG